MERPLSAARKSSVEERDPEEAAFRVRQAIQRENDHPVQSPELISRNTVHVPSLLNLGHCLLKMFSLLLTVAFMLIQSTYLFQPGLATHVLYVLLILI